jgi:type I restriction enzyme S subunit
MTLETFFEKFDLFADAPNAVGKMRELVLELAVQGNLSEHLSGDEKEPKWLELVKHLEEVPHAFKPEIEPPIVIPDWWRWTTLEQLGNTKPRNNAEDSRNSSFVPMTLIPAGYGQSARHEERPWGDIKKGYTHFANGDVVMAKITPCYENGKSAIIENMTGGFGAGTTELHVFRRLFEGILPEFVILYLKTRGFITRGIPRMTGSAGQKRVPSDYFARSPFPLPPLAEQKRIVAKVDELMALCDRLEAQQQERQTRHATLARASLARFADAPTPANLNLLFHKSYTIPPADLRKSILTLAVQGKLVPQDPKDEPAEKALGRCGVDLKRWAVSKDAERQEAPDSWTWIRFAGVGDQRLGKMLDAQKNRGESKPYLRNTNLQWLRFQLDDVKEMRVEEREADELRLKYGDLLICEGGEPGRCAIWRNEVPEMYFQKALHRVRPCAEILSEYLSLNLQIDCRNDVLSSYFTGATIKHLTGRSLSAYPIPIPPLAEQRRIVAKVDQLMALVDELETQLAASRATAKNLLEALVVELTAEPQLAVAS